MKWIWHRIKKFCCNKEVGVFILSRNLLSCWCWKPHKMYKIYNIEPPYVRCLSIKYLAPLFFPLWLADRHQSYDFLPYVFGRSLNILVCLRLSVVRTLWLMWSFIANTTTTDFNNPFLWFSRSTKFVQNLLYTDCHLIYNPC